MPLTGRASRAILFGAVGTAGQRCTSTRRGGTSGMPNPFKLGVSVTLTTRFTYVVSLTTANTDGLNWDVAVRVVISLSAVVMGIDAGI